MTGQPEYTHTLQKTNTWRRLATNHTCVVLTSISNSPYRTRTRMTHCAVRIFCFQSVCVYQRFSDYKPLILIRHCAFLCVRVFSFYRGALDANNSTPKNMPPELQSKNVQKRLHSFSRNLPDRASWAPAFRSARRKTTHPVSSEPSKRPTARPFAFDILIFTPLFANCTEHTERIAHNRISPQTSAANAAGHHRTTRQTNERCTK